MLKLGEKDFRTVLVDKRRGGGTEDKAEVCTW